MYTFELYEKTGFYTPDNDLFIYCGDGSLFYKKSKKGKFNLPRGIYATEGKIEQLGKPINFRLPPLPSYEWSRKVPGEVKLIKGSNVHKCSIMLDKGIILLDPEICLLPKYALTFVLFHEIGHYFFQTEKYCDRFACREMLKIGYNPSQVAKASLLTLQKKNFDRIKDNVKANAKVKPQTYCKYE